MTEDSRVLIERYCRAGDQRAFSSFYRRHADRLWRFLRARGSDPESAYDLVSESFLKFIQNVCKDPRAPLGLLYRIAVNLQIDQYRRDRASPVSADDGAIERHAGGSGPPADERELVRRLVGRMDETEQNLLLMRYWIGLTHDETARVLGLPAGTVRRRAAEALARLRQLWQEDQSE